MIKKLFFKPETGFLTLLMVGAVTGATFHLTKSATDPHTKYSKSIDDREWEKEHHINIAM